LAFAGRQKLEDVRRVVLMLAKDHTRKSLMAVKTLAQILEQMRNGVRDEQAFNSKYAEILKIDDECKELRLQAERKVLRLGPSSPRGASTSGSSVASTEYPTG